MDEKLVYLFAIIAFGYLLGKVKIFGLSLGASGVIFAALAAGHFGLQIPAGVGTLGLVSFVYCLGIAAGPSFLRMFSSQGKVFVTLGATLVISALATTWVVARIAKIPVDLACGIFAGSMTSTPALAATSEVLPPDAQTAVGFGIAYPIGVVGVVLLVQLLPRLLGKTFDEMAAEARQDVKPRPSIERALVEVINPAVVGKRLSELEAIERSNCQVTRFLVEKHLRPIPAEFSLQLGQTLLAVGPPADLQLVCDLLGRRSESVDFIIDAEQQRAKVVVSSQAIVGKSLRKLRLLSRFGVTIARITRHDYEFVPRPSDVIQFADALTAVGEPECLERFSAFAGHREKAFDETSIISLSIGILAGVLLGAVKVEFGQTSISLGMAGGPLLVGLLLGHFGRLGPFVGHLPRASRTLMTDLGLAFFLADAGVIAGSSLAPVLRDHGLVLCGGAVVITSVPMVVGFVIGRYVMRLSLLQVLGIVCGGMTSTPGLGVINSKTDSDVPIVSYAAVYPIALFLVTILGRLLVSLLS